MSISSRCTVGIHALTLLARSGEDVLSSEAIAESVNSNPVFIRRVLGKLREASVVRSVDGRGGGWRLARVPEEITLRDIYEAVEETPLFSMHARPPSSACIVARNIQRALQTEFDAAEKAMEERLTQTTIADMLRSVMAPTGDRDGRSESRHTIQ